MKLISISNADYFALVTNISKQATELRLIQTPQMYHLEDGDMIDKQATIFLYYPVNGLIYHTTLFIDMTDEKYVYDNERYTSDQVIMILNRSSIELNKPFTDEIKLKVVSGNE